MAKRCRSGKVAKIKPHKGWFEVYVDKKKIMEGEDLAPLIKLLDAMEVHYIIVQDSEPSFDINGI